MDVQKEVLRLLDDTLSLGGRSSHFTRDTRLLGAIPELDSMAVVSVITALEEQFGMLVDDDDIDGDTFASVGALTDFVSGKLAAEHAVRGELQAFFLDAGPGRAGQRFCLYHQPVGGAVRGTVVYVHPFAEEMNKSRRMAALQSRALAEAGFAVLQIDLLGCGDSSGDFGDASWQDWIDDVLLAVRWLRERHDAPLCLWGLRTGCLLATDAARRLAAPLELLFWQPAISGKLALQQFLRLKLAGDMLDGAAAKGQMQPLREQMLEGKAVEVAGYSLAPGLARGLEQATLAQPAPAAGLLRWLEVSTRDEPALLPATAPVLQAWRDVGTTVLAHAVPGRGFWQTAEIEEAPALLDLTLALMCDKVIA